MVTPVVTSTTSSQETIPDPFIFSPFQLNNISSKLILTSSPSSSSFFKLRNFYKKIIETRKNRSERSRRRRRCLMVIIVMCSCPSLRVRVKHLFLSATGVTFAVNPCKHTAAHCSILSSSSSSSSTKIFPFFEAWERPVQLQQHPLNVLLISSLRKSRCVMRCALWEKATTTSTHFSYLKSQQQQQQQKKNTTEFMLIYKILIFIIIIIWRASSSSSSCTEQQQKQQQPGRMKMVDELPGHRSMM